MLGRNHMAEQIENHEAKFFNHKAEFLTLPPVSYLSIWIDKGVHKITQDVYLFVKQDRTHHYTEH